MQNRACTWIWSLVDEARYQVIYVWLDALANYLTVAGWEEGGEGVEARFSKAWPPDVQVIGKYSSS